MAKTSLIYVMLLVFLPILATSSSNHKHYGSKTKQFTLYQHDIISKTDLIVVPGHVIAGSPFGTIGVIKDNLTLTIDPSSKVVGDTEALLVTSSIDGMDGLSVGRTALQLEDGLSGTITAVGVTNTRKSSDVPVTGGTGDFLFVQGHITTTLVSVKELTFVYKVDFLLFWPPYSPYAIKG